MKTTKEERAQWRLNWQTDIELWPDEAESDPCDLTAFDALRLLADADAFAQFMDDARALFAGEKPGSLRDLVKALLDGAQ
jgi:hypothetical protein